MITEQQKRDIQNWANEYNETQEKGRIMWDQLKSMAKRMEFLKDSIDEIDPDCYEPLGVLFGASIDIEF